MGVLDYFSATISVQLFYALCITLIVYAIPAGDRSYLVEFTSSPANIDIGETASEFQTSFNSTAGFGVVDVAALALFSGNIVIDLILNFFTAIPSMATLLLKGVFLFFPVDAGVQNLVLTFTYLSIGIIYAISLMNFLINVRSRTQGVL